MSLDVTYFVVTFNGMGGHPLGPAAARFLLEGAPPLGSAFTALDLYAHARSSAPPAGSTLTRMWERFPTRISSLPLFWLRRSRKLIVVSYATTAVSGDDLNFWPLPRSSPGQFQTAVREIAAIPALIRRRLRRDDDLRLDDLERHFQERLADVPITQLDVDPWLNGAG